MVSIRELFQDTLNNVVEGWGLYEFLDETLSDGINSQDENFLLLLRTPYLTCHSRMFPQIQELQRNNYIAGIFEFPSVYTGWTALTVIQLKKVHSSSIKCAIYSKNGSKTISIENSIPPQNDNFDKYINAVDTWINGGLQPDSYKDVSFFTIEYSELNRDYLNPNYYAPDVVLFRKQLAKEKMMSLQKVAEFIVWGNKEFSGNLKNVYVYTADDCKKHTEFSILSRKDVDSGLLLQDKDILVPIIDFYRKDFCFYRKTVETDVYADNSVAVIRVSERVITPEYLYLYLISDTAQSLFKSFDVGGVQRRIQFAAIKSLPVLIPDKGIENYSEIYSKLKSKSRIYEM